MGTDKTSAAATRPGTPKGVTRPGRVPLLAVTVLALWWLVLPTAQHARAQGGAAPDWDTPVAADQAPLLAAVEDALAQAPKASEIATPLPAGFCGVAYDEDHADYAGALRDEMAVSGHRVFEIAIPCAEKEEFDRPQTERRGFSQWIIIAGHKRPDGGLLRDVGLEPEAFLNGLMTEIETHTSGVSDFAEATGDDRSEPDFFTPIRDPEAVYWPLSLSVEVGEDIMPVAGMAALTLLERMPVVSYWYANESLVTRSSDALLRDQRALIGAIRKAADGAGPGAISEGPAAHTGGSGHALWLGGAVAALILGAGLWLRRRKARAPQAARASEVPPHPERPTPVDTAAWF